MTKLTSTVLPPLSFDFSNNINPQEQEFVSPGNKIGWIHSVSDQPGVSYDLTIKDGLKRIIEQKKCGGTESKEFGEKVGMHVRSGEKLNFEISNVKGGNKIDLFIN